MSADSLEGNRIALHFIDQQPVRLDVTFSAERIIPDQFMIPMDGIQAFVGNQGPGD